MASTRYVSPCDVATVYAGLGNTDRVFENLQKCYDDKAWQIIFLKTDPVFKPYRNDPRYVAMVKKLNLQ